MNEDGSHYSLTAQAFADEIEAALCYYFTLYTKKQHA